MAPHNAAAALALHRAGPPRQCRGCHYGKPQPHNTHDFVEPLMCDCPVSFNFDELVNPNDVCNHWEAKESPP